MATLYENVRLVTVNEDASTKQELEGPLQLQFSNENKKVNVKVLSGELI